MSLIGLPQVAATLTPSQFTATAAQTTFTPPGGYTAPYVQVMRNGSMLGSGDFTATNGTTVVLNSACSAGDQVVIWSFGTFSVASPQYSDANFLLFDNADATKKLSFELSGLTTGTTRTVTMPDASGTMAVVDGAYADYYASSTIVGWSSLTAGRRNINYQKTGRRVDVWFHLEGTSNSTSVSFTLPYAATATYGTPGAALLLTYDNSTYSTTIGHVYISGSTANSFKSNDRAAWTASGTKIVAGQFFYFTD